MSEIKHISEVLRESGEEIIKAYCEARMTKQEEKEKQEAAK